MLQFEATECGNRAEIDQALAAAERGPMSEEELAFMRAYGCLFKHQPQVAEHP